MSLADTIPAGLDCSKLDAELSYRSSGHDLSAAGAKAFKDGKSLASIKEWKRTLGLDDRQVGICEAGWRNARDEKKNGVRGDADAIQIVLDLARQNIIDERDNPEEHARQTEACDTLEDFAVNQLGDD